MKNQDIPEVYTCSCVGEDWQIEGDRIRCTYCLGEYWCVGVDLATITLLSPISFNARSELWKVPNPAPREGTFKQ